jgi:hypothetical protein
MRIALSLLCGLLLLCSSSFYAQETGQSKSTSAQAVAQTGQMEGNKKIVVIFKGSKKDPAANVTLEGKDVGELAFETYLEMKVKNGSYTVGAGKYVTHSVVCYIESMQSGGGCSAGGSQDHVPMQFQPATLKVDVGENEATYILIERFKPESTCCNQLGSKKLMDYKMKEIKAKDGEKYLSKYKALQ